MIKTVVLRKEDEIFIDFYDYGTDNEKDDFDDFVRFVTSKLGVSETWIVETVFDDLTKFEFRGEVLTLGWEYGCYLRIPPESKISPEEIIKILYE